MLLILTRDTVAYTHEDRAGLNLVDGTTLPPLILIAESIIVVRVAAIDDALPIVV